MLFVHILGLQCLVCLASVEECYSTHITTVFQELPNIITSITRKMPFVKRSVRISEISSCVESEQTYLVSRSLIPIPLLNCNEFYAVLFKQTSYLEGGRVICEAKKS